MKQKKKTPKSAAAPAPAAEVELEDPIPAPNRRGILQVVWGIALAIMALYGGFLFLNIRYGGALVHDRENHIGELVLEQAEQFEQAEQYEKAETAYRAALQTKFASPKNKAFVLKKLGTLIWWRFGPEKAVPFLEQCLAMQQHPLSVYEILSDSYLKLNQRDKAANLLEQWRLEGQSYPEQVILMTKFQERLNTLKK